MTARDASPSAAPEALQGNEVESLRVPAARWRGAVTFVLMVAAVVLVWRLSARVGWHDLLVRLRAAEAGTVALAALLLAARYAAVEQRWSGGLRALGLKPRFGRLYLMVAAATLVNHITPSARLLGGVVRARYARHLYGRRFSEMYGAVLFETASHQVVLGAITWICVIALSWVLGWIWLALAAAGLLAGVTAYLVTGGGRRAAGSPLARLLRRRLEGLGRGSGRLAAGGREAARVFSRLLELAPLRRRLLFAGVAFFLCNLLAQLAIFRGLGVDAGPLVVAVAVGLGAGAGILLGTPGGLGTTEAAMIACYVTLGLDRADAVAGTMLYRGLHYAVVVAIGLPALLYCELQRPGRLRAPAPSAPGGGAEDARSDAGRPPDRGA